MVYRTRIRDVDHLVARLVEKWSRFDHEINYKTILKSFRIVSVFRFGFISHVTTSEIKLKQHCFVSVLFQFYFRCNHCLKKTS